MCAVRPREHSLTVSLPLDAIGGITVQSPAPALISPDVNPEHVGLTRSGLQDVLRMMRADAVWEARVIVLSRKRIAAAPQDVIAFMRSRCPASSAERDDAEPMGGVDAVLEAAGCERVSRRVKGAR